MTNDQLVILLPDGQHGLRRALTSVPWPADRDDIPVAAGLSSQTVALFSPHSRPRLKRFLLLCSAENELPAEITVHGQAPLAAGPGGAEDDPDDPFSGIQIEVLRERLEKRHYVYQECEARVQTPKGTFGLRMALLPSDDGAPSGLDRCSWWQWCRAERLWSGPVAEAWRIGGHLVPYAITAEGGWTKPTLLELGEQLREHSGDILHGDLYLIVWRDGGVQITAHFKAGYLHYWARSVGAFPALAVTGLTGEWGDSAITDTDLIVDDGAGAVLDFSPSALMFEGVEGTISAMADGVLIQPWHDLRVVANKTIENKLEYLEPQRADSLPAGVSRTFRMTLALDGQATGCGRYHVPAAWYRHCAVIETDRAGAAAKFAAPTLELIRQCTQIGGFDTGRIWRHLRRDLRSGVPEQDCAEWEGNMAQAMFTFAYQRDASPDGEWDLILQQAYHGADIAVHHGSWMYRLEGSVVFSAPMPKARIGGTLYAYLETGDPYLLDVSRSVIDVFMAVERAQQPRFCMGRDAYPLAGMMALWDYCAESQYLDFALQTAHRLVATQMPDGGFAGQAGAGAFSGTSCKVADNSISFGNGLLAPLGLMEWAVRDERRDPEIMAAIRKWADLMLRLQPQAGAWTHKKDVPYPLIGAGALFSLTKAGELLSDSRCAAAVSRFLEAMDQTGNFVAGVHSFLPLMYAHVADAALEKSTDND